MSGAGDNNAAAPPVGIGIPIDTIYDAIDHGITVIDREGRFIAANRAALRTLGFPDLEALIRTPVEEVRARYQHFDETGQPIPIGDTPVALAMKGLRPNTRTLRSVPVDGGPEKWFSVRAIPLLDEAGHVKAVVSVVHDLTEFHDTNKRLRDSESRFRELVEATDDLVSWSDMEGRILYVNSRSRQFLGVDPDDLIGEDGMQYLHPDDVPVVDEAFHDWVGRGGEGALTMEYRLLPRSGGICRVSAQITVAKDARGAIVGVRNISRDITEAHAEQEALGALSAAIERAIPLAEAGPEALPQLIDACHAALEAKNGVVSLSEDDPVVRLIDVARRLAEALQRSLPRDRDSDQD